MANTDSGNTVAPSVASQPKLPNYFVVSGIAILAAGISFAWWSKDDVSMFFASAEIRRGQLWRLFTTIFPHLDFLHLAFNIYWLWVFGTVIERIYGHARTASLIFLFAIGSTSVDFAFARGGVGLSGVGYGLFGLLWVLSHHDERFKGSLDRRTIKLFLGWFVLCIVGSLTHVYAVANVAHAAGAVLGILTGYAIVLPSRRKLVVSTIAAIVVFGIWGSTVGRPFVNLSGKAGYEEARWGYDSLNANRNEEAVHWLHDAVRLQPKQPAFWFDLGIAYQRTGNVPAAMNAYQRAHQLEPENPKYSSATEDAN